MYRGDIALGTTQAFKFTTRRFTTGAPFALAGGVISAYVDSGTTQITAGITLTADFDTVTGLNNISVVATSGNGFAAGTNVDLVITTGTVDSVSVVGEVVASFSIENRSGLRPTVAGRTLGVEASGKATGVVLADTVTTVTGLTASDVGAIKTKTDFLPSFTAGASGGLPINGANVGNVSFSGTYTYTGHVAYSDGMAVTCTTVNRSAISAIGNGVGHGIYSVGYNGLYAIGTGDAGGMFAGPFAGLYAYGINAGSDGIVGVAGAGGADIRSNITGNLSGSVGSVTGAVGSVTGAVGSVTAGVTLTASGSATLTEGYRALGAAGTMNQLLYEILAIVTEKSIASTTLTTKKVDRVTTAATYTLDSATQPLAITRAT